MGKKLESAIQKDITDLFREKAKMQVLKLRLLGIRGIPDLVLVIGQGKILWMEVKRPGKELTPMQKWFHKIDRKSVV